MNEFDEGFRLGTRFPPSTAGLISALRGGSIGTARTLAAEVGTPARTASEVLWKLHTLKSAHICLWQDYAAVFAYGKGNDAKRPPTKEELAKVEKARAKISAKIAQEKAAGKERAKKAIALAKKRLDSASKRLAAERASRVAKAAAQKAARLAAFMARTTPAQKAEAEAFRKTHHGREILDGHVRIHRME